MNKNRDYDDDERERVRDDDDDDERLDEAAACAFIGGSRPIDPSTLWRGVKAGIYSKPSKVGLKIVRWTRGKLRDDLARLADNNGPPEAA